MPKETNLNRMFACEEQLCSKCKKQIIKSEICWVSKGISEKSHKQYFCIPCGNQILEQGKLQAKIQGRECFFSDCQNKISEREIIYQCKDSGKKFCSKEHFKKVYGLCCSCCEKEVNEKITYLEIVQPKKVSLFWWKMYGSLLVIVLVAVVMTTLIVKSEKRKSMNKKSQPTKPKSAT